MYTSFPVGSRASGVRAATLRAWQGGMGAGRVEFDLAERRGACAPANRSRSGVRPLLRPRHGANALCRMRAVGNACVGLIKVAFCGRGGVEGRWDGSTGPIKTILTRCVSLRAQRKSPRVPAGNGATIYLRTSGRLLWSSVQNWAAGAIVDKTPDRSDVRICELDKVWTLRAVRRTPRHASAAPAAASRRV